MGALLRTGDRYGSVTRCRRASIASARCSSVGDQWQRCLFKTSAPTTQATSISESTVDRFGSVTTPRDQQDSTGRFSTSHCRTPDESGQYVAEHRPGGVRCVVSLVDEDDEARAEPLVTLRVYSYGLRDQVGEVAGTREPGALQSWDCGSWVAGAGSNRRPSDFQSERKARSEGVKGPFVHSTCNITA